jgi:hypothetical protein
LKLAVSQLTFPSPKTAKPLSPAQLQKAMNRLMSMTELGLPKAILEFLNYLHHAHTFVKPNSISTLRRIGHLGKDKSKAAHHD